MRQEPKDSRIPIVTAKKNADTLYNGRNTTRK
jgi:hypothetical protein